MTDTLLPVTVALLSHSPEWKLPWNRLRVVTHNFGILWYSSLTFCRGSHVLHSRSLSVLCFLKTHKHSPNMGWRLPAVGSLSSLWDVGALQQALWCFQKAPENRNLSPALVSKALYLNWKRLRWGGNLVQKCKSWSVVGIRVDSTGVWFLRVLFLRTINVACSGMWLATLPLKVLWICLWWEEGKAAFQMLSKSHQHWQLSKLCPEYALHEHVHTYAALNVNGPYQPPWFPHLHSRVLYLGVSGICYVW